MEKQKKKERKSYIHYLDMADKTLMWLLWEEELKLFYNLLKNLLKAAITLAKHFLPRHAGGILGHFAISSGLRQATEKKKKKGCFFFSAPLLLPN